MKWRSGHRGHSGPTRLQRDAASLPGHCDIDMLLISSNSTASGHCHGAPAPTKEELETCSQLRRRLCVCGPLDASIVRGMLTLHAC